MCSPTLLTADMNEEEGSLDKAWVSLHKMTTPSRGLVLKLYRRCLRHADRLTYTDRDFYKMKVREEFKMAKEAKGKRVVQQIKVNTCLLYNGRGQNFIIHYY